MYEGYLSHAGTEIMNAMRTKAYIDNQMPQFPLEDVASVRAEDLRLALGDGEYESPLVDGAPWLDESDPSSQKFYGLYPISIDGDGDSTRTVEITESLLDGGVAGRGRHGTRELRVRALMIGETKMALESGMTWLRNALEGGCGSDGGCNGDPLCFFADAPSLCPDMVDESEPVDTISSFGSLSPATSPLIYRLPSKLGPAEATWEPQLTEGAIVRYGAMALGDQTQLEISEAISLQRTNYFIDAGVRHAELWKVTGTSALTTPAAGGRNGGQYGRVATPAASTFVLTNWMTNSRFQLDPVESGWVSNGVNGIPAIVDPDAPAGARVAEVLASTASTELWAEGPIDGPVVAGPVAIRLMIARADLDDITIMTVNPEGNVVTTFRPSLTSTYTLVEFAATAGAGWKLRIYGAGSTSRLRFTRIMVTSGSLAATEGITYFDGDSTDLPSPTQSHAFYLDGTPLSPSRYARNTASATPTIVEPVERIEALAKPAMVSFWMRTPGWAAVTLRILRDSDSVVLATTSFQLTHEWVRYSLLAPDGSSVRVELASRDSFDFDDGLFEPGSMLQDYIDGDEIVPGYTVVYLGGATRSISRQTYTAAMRTVRDDSDWRPFIISVIGTVPIVDLETRQYQQVDITECIESYQRTYQDVTVIDGPKITKKFATKVGAMQAIEIVFNAGKPFAYRPTRELFDGPLGSITGTLWNDPAAPVAPITVIRDPDCPPLLMPPRPPSVPDACVDTSITAWRRYRVSVPGYEVPEWALAVPTIRLQTATTDKRQVRVRFFPNPFGWAPEKVDPHSFCAEFIISYLPAGTEMVIDGTVERATASVAGADPVPVNNLLYGTDGVPISWPSLSCGIPYVVTIDVPPGESNDLGIELALTRRE